MIWKRLLATLLLCLTLTRANAETPPLVIFAAASLGDALGEIGALWFADTGQEVRVVAAGSATMARQVAAGAPADLVILASPDWIEWLDAQGALVPGSRRDLLQNRLVLVSHGPDVEPISGDPKPEIPERLGDGRLAVALTEAVPAGIYAQAALRHLGLWEALNSQLAEADNVRAALAYVAAGATPLGIVYSTDAVADPRVSVIFEFPAKSHPPIVYPAAATVLGGAEAQVFLDWLATPPATQVFADHGFLPGSAE